MGKLQSRERGVEEGLGPQILGFISGFISLLSSHKSDGGLTLVPQLLSLAMAPSQSPDVPQICLPHTFIHPLGLSLKEGISSCLFLKEPTLDHLS